MNIVAFCGAGFSAPFGMPVMNSFLNDARKNPKITQKEIEFLDDLRLKARRANAFLESSPNNFEDMLTFAQMEDDLQIDSVERVNCVDTVIKIIQKIYTYTNPTDLKEYWPKYNSFKEFWGDALNSKKYNISFITTNYDLNIECALYSSRERANINFSYEPANNNDNRKINMYSTNGKSLYKLHGSVNWFIGNDNKIKIEDEIVNIFHSNDNIPSKERVLPSVCTRDYSCPGLPFIIPPTYLKPDFKNPLDIIWSNAAHNLKESEILIFIGFSFPNTDTEMKYFFASSLTENANLRRILIIDPNAKEILDGKIKKSNYGSHFTELARPISSSWTEIKWNDILKLI